VPDDEICGACFVVAVQVGEFRREYQKWLPLRPTPNLLVLVPLDPDADADELWKAAQPIRASDTSALRWHRSFTRCTSPDEFRTALHRTQKIPAREEYTVTVVGHGPGFGPKIGVVALQDLHSAAEWGIWIGSRYRKTSAYHEALAITLTELFEVRGLHRVQFRIHIGNTAALAAAEDRAGYIAEGILKQSFREADGSYADEKVFGLLEQQWAVVKPVLLTAMLYPRMAFPDEMSSIGGGCST
jgi:RimJ/RimL family protein N-acetyltransferase